uniref:Uncharacterized protein n=1 Tax=Photinus pyralis TaxID=7054 RepID=A0A1Y1L006_PHOPY
MGQIIKHIALAIKCFKVTVTGRVRSPRILHRSEIVINPTNITAKSPTNFTEIQHDNIKPVKINQLYHLKENSRVESEDTLIAPRIDPIKKHSNRGSNKMYCVNVIKPTSSNINSDENRAAVTECVISSTIKNDIGTIVAPTAVQNTLIPI